MVIGYSPEQIGQPFGFDGSLVLFLVRCQRSAQIGGNIARAPPGSDAITKYLAAYGENTVRKVIGATPLDLADGGQ